MMYTDTKLKEYNEREERFRLAIEEATTNKSASINSIANKYKVSRTTLSRRIHGFKNTRNSHEKQQKFTNDEELTIVGHIQSLLRDQHHIPQKREILQMCENLLKDKHKDQQDIDPSFFKVGKNWIDRFLERHNSELMINEQVTLTEYYKNEFLERKKLRTDRGYKTTSVGSLTPDEESVHATPHSSNSPASHHSMPQPHDQSHLHQSHRGSYQQHEASSSSSFMYHDQSVNMNPYGSTAPSSGPQLPQQQHQQQQHQPQHQPHQPQQQYSEWQPQQPQYATNISVKPSQSQSPYVPPQSTHMQPPPPLPYGSVPVFSKFSYSYPQPAVANGSVVSYDRQASSSSSSLPSQNQVNQPSAFSINNGLHTFGFPQGGTSSTAVNVEGTGASTSDVDMMQFYQNGRFQYELARLRLIRELELGNIDNAGLTRMLNFVFAQIDRDVSGVSSVAASAHASAHSSAANTNANASGNGSNHGNAANPGYNMGGY